jgi:methylenetetrahydrofolate dehydrogenase (NADP+)/methenyltetrahydrofolate cyclohydrolase
MFLYGKPLAQKIISGLKNRKKLSGSLSVVQLGNDPTSSLYVTKKGQLAEELGIDFRVVKLKPNASFSELKNSLEKLNKDKTVRAILLQMPLPAHLDRNAIAGLIEQGKDVDGFGYIIGKTQKPMPPTVLAIVDLLSFYKINLDRKRILIIGGGFLVGKPLYRYLLEKKFQVKILQKDDTDYFKKVKDADVILTATGRGANFSYSDFKVGATVVDASTVCEGGFTKGDVNIEGWGFDKNLAPVPGGLGPVTIAELFSNFFKL